jgi:CheY-like chemotaxis protein
VGAVAGDFDRLQQIAWNLLSNAVKFTPKGGLIQICLQQVNSHVELSVIDTGQGIKPDFVPYVFDRFRQADSSSTRIYNGLGLGLAIVRQLVELHGGTVHAESQGEGQGATFTVKLPMLPIRLEVNPEEQVHPTDSSGFRFDNLPELNGIRVLLVDDEADARGFMITALEVSGAEVVGVSSVSEAMATILLFKPDVLVSDIGMPNEDGYSLIRKLRQLTAEQGGKIPAIALTAYARAEDKIKAINSGFQKHIPKPVEPAELLKAVATLAKSVGKV